MASTYSTNLKIELQATGENPGTWGTITNTNLGTALEQAIVGYGNPSYASDANLTLTYTNTNAAQTARSLVLNVTSAVSLTATRELVVPTIQKQYIVQNNTTGAQSITVKTSAGTGITVPNGRKAHLYVDGTNVIQMFDFVDINGGAIDGVTLGTSSAVTEAQIDNINLNGNTISSTDTNGNLILAPNGTGDVQVNADTLRVGDSNVDATITTNGTGDLILNTNSGSSSGSIRIYDGANGDIEVTASGTGSFNVAPNMLVGTTTDFTTTGAAGGVAVAGYGIYPYTTYSASSPSGLVNTINTVSTVFAPSASFSGATSSGYYGLMSLPSVSATGAGGTGGTFLYSLYASPQLSSSGASGRVALGGIYISSVRASSSDASSDASNAVVGVFSAAGIEGTVSSGASATEIIGFTSTAYSGSGTSTQVYGYRSSVEATSVGTDQNTTITNVAAYAVSRIRLGLTSGATSTVTNLYGVNITGVDVRATATVNNYYAFFAAAPTVTGTLTNRWGVYIADASSPNYFAGSVQVGAGTAAAPTLTTIADTNTGVFFPAADVVGVSTGGTERARITSNGNLLVGTTTDFTSTTSAGAIAAAGIGNYPYISGTGSSGDVTASANNIGILHQAPLFTATGGSFTPITSVLVAPRVRNTGSGGTGQAFVVGINSAALVEGTSANARIGAVGLRAFAVRTSALDVSTQTSNDVYGATGTAGHDAVDLTGTPTWPQVYTRNIVGVGGAANVYAGRTGAAGVSANVACSFLSIISVTSSTISGNTEVNNVARYWGDSFYVGATSGPTGVVTNAYGLHMPGPIVQATGTVTNYYGVYLTAPTVTGTLANRWAIYSADASSPSYFAGSVQVGAGTAAAPTLTTIADTNTGVFFPAADVVGVSTNGTERARVKSTGQVRFVPLSADPAGAEAGDVYYNSTTNKLKVYNGSAWVDLH